MPTLTAILIVAIVMVVVLVIAILVAVVMVVSMVGSPASLRDAPARNVRAVRPRGPAARDEIVVGGRAHTGSAERIVDKSDGADHRVRERYEKRLDGVDLVPMQSYMGPQIGPISTAIRVGKPAARRSGFPEPDVLGVHSALRVRSSPRLCPLCTARRTHAKLENWEIGERRAA